MNVFIIYLIPASIWFLTSLILESLRNTKNRWFQQPVFPLTTLQYRDAIVKSSFNMAISSASFFLVFPWLEHVQVHDDPNTTMGPEILRLVLSLFLSDTFFYWLHRLLHTKILYKVAHKIHHRHKSAIAWSSFYFHPIELVLTWFLVFLLPILLVRLHYITLMCYITILLLSLVKSHCGIDIYGLYSSKFHDMHHLKFVGNYGSDLGFWDKVVGTVIT